MFALLAAAVAVAASPGGFRVGAGASADVAGLRQVVVPVVAGPRSNTGGWTLQSVPFSQVTVGPLVLGAELPAVVAWGDRWSIAGIGQLRTRVGVVDDEGATSVGLVVAFPVVGPQHAAHAWGSASRETLPGFEMMGSFEHTYGDEVLHSLRAGFGVRVGLLDDPSDRGILTGDLHPAIDLAMAHVLPIRGPVALVIEEEWAWDAVPLALRTLGRVDVGPFAADLGVQCSASPGAIWLAGIAQVRGVIR